MRIARFTHDGRTGLGRVEGDEIVDLRGVLAEPDVGALLAGPGLAFAAADGPSLALADVRLEAPILRPPEFLAVGVNYGAHAAETRREAPDFPVIFNKQSSCVNGPYDDIEIPRVAPDNVDYEGELGFVIGVAGRHVAAEHARDVIAGYLAVNDVSVRDWQRASPTWTMGKSFDTHGVIGPWLVTADEIADPHELGIRTWVNGELRQDSNTRDLLLDCDHQIAFLSSACTLAPGTVVATGTPSGVGMAMDPPCYLVPGDVVRIEVEGIGVIENRVVAEPAAD